MSTPTDLTPLFDTHCHLNFEVFSQRAEEAIAQARLAGVAEMVVVGTTIANSRRAVELAQQHEGVRAAVGVHPHQAFALLPEFQRGDLDWDKLEFELSELLAEPKVAAVGEIGFDRWHYPKTRYEDYRVTPEFIALQHELFHRQLRLAQVHQKSVIFHNRLAVADLLRALDKAEKWLDSLEWLRRRAVFHCCEPELSLLDVARERGIFVGVAGDVARDRDKQEFVSLVPQDLLVLETDAPFLHPAGEKQVSTPADLPILLRWLADFLSCSETDLRRQTWLNSNHLFSLVKMYSIQQN